jgi:hypothetical protein
MFPDNVQFGLSKYDVDIVEQAMVLTALRGNDSTGIAMVHSANNKPRVFKSVGDPYHLLHSQEWDKVSEFIGSKTKAIFGHGRAATKGSVNTKNAHPFTHEHITLVHNGTIHYGLTEHHDKDVEVDSHALCVAIAKEGLVKALDGIVGAYALIVHDSKEGVIHVVRNTERPLHRVVLAAKQIIMSEAAALDYLLARNNLGYAKPVVEYFKPELIYTYDLTTGKWSSNDELEKLTKKYSPPATTSTYQPTGKGSVKSSGTDVYVTGGIEMMCVAIEESKTNAKVFHYKFVDDLNIEYVAMSSSGEEKHRLGQMARSLVYKKLTEGRYSFNFVKFRDLEWIPDEPEDKEITTVNNKKVQLSKFKELCKKQDCSICQGPVYSNEAKKTWLTEGDSFICGNCVEEGKHHAYGYGQ